MTSSVARPLLIVEEAFRAGGAGVLVSPRFVPDPAAPPLRSVRLKTPGGVVRMAVAELQVSHIRGPMPPYALLRLPELAPEDVPPGTEVWAV